MVVSYFKIEPSDKVDVIKCYTTRPDTLFGMSFLALSIDHPVSKLYENNNEFLKFKKECSATGTTEESIANAKKIGFKTNLIAVNPLNQEKVRLLCKLCFNGLWIRAVFGCPAHDQRDWISYKYKLKVKPVVKLI